MQEYLNRCEDILEKVEEVGVIIPDTIKAGMTLPGLPKKKYGELVRQFKVEDKFECQSVNGAELAKLVSEVSESGRKCWFLWWMQSPLNMLGVDDKRRHRRIALTQELIDVKIFRDCAYLVASLRQELTA